MPPADGPVAQLDRASDFGSEGWGFDSLRGRHSKSRFLTPADPPATCTLVTCPCSPFAVQWPWKHLANNLASWGRDLPKCVEASCGANLWDVFWGFWERSSRWRSACTFTRCRSKL